MQRWGVGPAVAMRRLRLQPRCLSTLLPEPMRRARTLCTTVGITPRPGDEETAAAVPGTTDALCEIEPPSADFNSCPSAGPPHMRSAAHAPLASVTVIAPAPHIMNRLISGGAEWDSLSSSAGVVLHREKCTPSIGGTAAAMRAPAGVLKRIGRVAHGKFGACGVTTPRSQDELLSSSDQGSTDGPVHPYNGEGTSYSAGAASEGDRVVYGQAYRYDVALSPPPRIPSGALAATASSESAAFLRKTVPRTPLRERSAPFFSTRDLRCVHAVRRPLKLRLPASSFISHPSDHVCAAKGEAGLFPPRCPRTTKRRTSEPPDVRCSHSGESAHPYEVPAPAQAPRPGSRHCHRHSGRVSRHGRHCDCRRGTDGRDVPTRAVDTARDVEQVGEVRRASTNQSVADTLADHGRAACSVVASPLTPTPPARDGNGCCLSARQRTENAKRYLQALMSASALRRTNPSPTEAKDLRLQQVQRAPRRYDASDTLATPAEAPPSRVASSSSNAGSSRKKSLNHWRQSGDGDEAMTRCASMSRPQLQLQHQRQRYLHSSPQTNIPLSQPSSISTHSSITPIAVPGDAASASLGDQAASVSAVHDNMQLCVGGADGRSVTEAASLALAGVSVIPSMVTSPESSLGVSASSADALPDTHVSPHPAAGPFPNAANVTVDDAARSEKDDALSARLTSYILSSFFARLQVLLQLAPPPPSTQARRFPHLDWKPAGLPLSPFLENRDARPRAHAPPELRSPSLSSAHPLLSTPGDAEVLAAAAAVDLRNDRHRSIGIKSSPPSEVLSPPHRSPSSSFFVSGAPHCDGG
ncbi:hypothetical protein LSCM4_02034 [Leishmania orientalis]|uniref:Uncharacterized protein n=1 Tax=Leishmania orientalis TaxID=2249476 RepID=A0A836GD11_9TRYP|nr:hypothetical protein LSCM4_02034 [Leishmania orientalis]